MYKNLNPECLGVSGRQSEVIELVLTYGFRGLDVDMADLAARAEAHGAEQARRFIDSAKKSQTGLRIGTFDLPLRWQGSEADYKAGLAEFGKIAEFAASCEATQCITNVMPACDDLPYHDNFEQHRKRLGEIADVLAQHGIRLGLGFLAPASYREGKQYQFIHQAEAILTLIKTIGNSNVGLALDMWHWRVGGGGLDQLRELPLDQFVSVRLADVPADADMATIEDDQRLLPGESEGSDSVPLLNMLGELGYEGPITVYSHPNRFTGMTRDAILQRVNSMIDEQWKAAGLSKSGKLAVAAEAS